MLIYLIHTTGLILILIYLIYPIYLIYLIHTTSYTQHAILIYLIHTACNSNIPHTHNMHT